MTYNQGIFLDCRKKKETSKKLVLGDDAIADFGSDFFDFKTPAISTVEHLYKISKFSGVCCGILGPWGSGKSSFMKLMEKYAKEKYGQSICTVWFTAWDPGGVEDLADALLLRFFQDVAEDQKELSKPLKQLEEALGARKNLREKARKILHIASEAIPEIALKTATGVACKVLEELSSPKKVKAAFDELINWLYEHNKTVFLFVDDIDRATGEQIRDIFSELKIYISNPGIVTVLGYDQDYVLKALKNKLPEGIDPKKYLEKIVPQKMHLPVPNYMQQINFAEVFLDSFQKISNEKRSEIAQFAVGLSTGNPRKLKTLLLNFSEHLLYFSKESRSAELVSLLIICAAFEMGLLSDLEVAKAFNKGDETAIIESLKAYAEKNTKEKSKVNLLLNIVERFNPMFVPNIVKKIRYAEFDYSWSKKRDEEKQSQKAYDWRQIINPIIKSAIVRGFELGREIVKPNGIAIAQLTKVRKQKSSITFLFKELERRRRSPDYTVHVLTSGKKKIVIIISSDFQKYSPHVQGRSGVSLTQFLNWVQNNCTAFVKDGKFILWIIDDIGCLSEAEITHFVERAIENSKSLKHSYSICYTHPSNVDKLLTSLLQPVIDKKTRLR